jgi:hypothetical protein
MYQSSMGVPRYVAGPVQSALEDALQSQMLQQFMPAGSALLGTRAVQQ